MLPLYLADIQLAEADQLSLRQLLITHSVPTAKIDRIVAGENTDIEVPLAGSDTLLQGLRQYDIQVRTAS